MKLKKTLSIISALSIISSMMTFPISAESENSSLLIDVSNMVIHDENLVYLGADYLKDCKTLFDEQEKVPSSVDNTNVDVDVWNSTSKTNWQPNMQSEYGEASFYIDLGANYVITGMCFLDTNGAPTWTISNGEPFNWNTIGSLTMDYYQSWRSITFDDNTPTRYLHFSSSATDTGVSEIAIYGYKVSELSEEQIQKTAPKENKSNKTNLTSGGKIGFNAFIDDPITSIIAGGNVREYHNFSWLLDDNGKVKFTQGTWGDMDSYYQAMKDNNISIIPCFQGTSNYIKSSKNVSSEIPVPDGADTTNPESYTIHAQTMYQVVSRYGSNSDIDVTTLNIADGQEVKTGLGLLSALENSNEPNKNWSGKSCYFSPYEMACMCSADYDGHEGTIENAGVKTADPDFKLAMGGLVSYSTMIDYLDEMKLWFDYNRKDGKFAVDIINVHMSPNACNPESSDFVQKIQELQSWIDNNAPNTELWISEYEINMSDCVVDNLDNHDNEDYQLKYAQRVARTYLLAVGQGVDRISKFQLRDEAEGVYYNSGLVTQKGEWNKKLAWYYTAGMSSVLENADFIQDISTDNVCIYQFLDRNTNETIYCLWSPTDNNTTIDNFELPIENGSSAYLTELGTYAEGVTSKIDVQDSSIKVNVSESPIFVTISNEEKSIVNGKHNQIKPKSICLTVNETTEVCNLEDNTPPMDSTLNQFYRMFDEPQTMPLTIYGNVPIDTPQSNVNQSNITGYVKLDKSYIFTGFGVYDTFGTGNISIYDAYTDTLLWENGLNAYMSKTIEPITETIPTDCIKIVKSNGDINELSLYGYAVEKQSQDLSLDYNKDDSINYLDLLYLKKEILIYQNNDYNIIDVLNLKNTLLV